MDSGELALDRINELYAQYRAPDFRNDWVASYLADVEYYRSLTDEEFRKPETQERLWTARNIASVGPGKAVTTKGAYNDPDVVSALLSVLRTNERPQDPERRARSIQESYDRILSLVYPKHSPKQPQIKLARAFTALLPHETTVCLNWKNHKLLTNLLLGPAKRRIQEGAVLCRQRIRDAVGEEADLEEEVRRSIFCWWLTHNVKAIADNAPIIKTTDDVRGTEDDETENEELVIWPVSKQRKGINAVTGYVETHRAVVIAAQGGATADDIVESLDAELSSNSKKSCRQIFSYVRSLEFLEHRDGLWYPSADGEEFVESDPPDILVERLLVRNYGLAQLLRQLSTNKLSKRQLFDALRAEYPRWTGDFMPSSLLAWSNSLGLTTIGAEQRPELTEYGEFWANRLPEKLPIPLIETEPESELAGDDEPVVWPNFAQVHSALENDPKFRTFIFSDSDTRSVHAAWHSQAIKRFVILSGLSGTGKTALLIHYARAYCSLVDVDADRHCAVVPVSPDWRDPSGLLGYFNALHADATFQAEPALRLVLAAARDPRRPYFLILDEMNLARVERYFAPFLSAMETGKDLILHAHDEEVNGVPSSIPWPKNLFIGGTVNMDETTHAFSDKVLDRAFTLEFFDVDLPGYFDKRDQGDGNARDRVTEDLLVKLNEALRPIRRHFGYRAANELLRFVSNSVLTGNYPDEHRINALDQAIFSKILPRLRGEETESTKNALEAVAALCKEQGLQRCGDKIEHMQEQLGHSGVTGFWS